ncbi:uncharacterized protein HKW66_Vig0072080 [Vigna angularis]|uniref:Uncharacterized protein n=1 Tax=Phaseolus angularis TaxID=3914 RepID=A0A8T0K706_PHAAN|nr:uncharacterized protein HKW66_Vig0072080 [Vigna angularis]
MAILLSKTHCTTHQFYSLFLGGRYFNATVTASASIVKRWLDSTLYFSRKYVYLMKVEMVKFSETAVNLAAFFQISLTASLFTTIGNSCVDL